MADRNVGSPFTVGFNLAITLINALILWIISQNEHDHRAFEVRVQALEKQTAACAHIHAEEARRLSALEAGMDSVRMRLESSAAEWQRKIDRIEQALDRSPPNGERENGGGGS